MVSGKSLKKALVLTLIGNVMQVFTQAHKPLQSNVFCFGVSFIANRVKEAFQS